MDNDKNQEVFRMLQCGDIALSQVYEKAVVMMGMTRRGKTTLGHFLSGQSLRGVKEGGKVFFKAINANSKYRNALIGNQANSMTQIPNYFQPIIGKNQKQKTTQKITLIDCPGFQDTYGPHRIITNGYFNYRVFSKVKNMKFIIVMKKQDLQSDAVGFIKTMKCFFQNFKNLEEYLDKILDATSLILTSSNEKNEDSVNKIIALKKFKPQALPEKIHGYIQKFIDYVVQKQKIYNFPSAKQNILASANANPLKDIVEKGKFWERQFTVQNQVVDVSKINFNIYKEIQANKSNEDFWQKFQSLMNHFNQNLALVIRIGIQQVFSQFIQDAVSPNQQSNKFIDVISDFVNSRGKFNPDFDVSRKALKAILFKQQPKETVINSATVVKTGSPQKTSDSNDAKKSIASNTYWVKKMKFLDQIFDQFIEFSDFMVKRNYQEIQEISSRVLKVVRSLLKITKTKPQRQQIIPNYGYILYRTFQEAKVFYLLVEKNKESKVLQVELTNMFDFGHPMKQAISNIFLFQLLELKRPFALKYQIKKDLQPKQYKQILQFYRRLIDENDKNIKNEKQQKPQKEVNQIKRNLNAKSTELIILSSSYYLKKGSIKDYKNCIILLNSSRRILDRQIQANPQQTQGNLIKIKLLILIMKNLGEFLQLCTCYKYARKCFESVYQIDKVLEMYNKQISNQDNLRLKRKLLLQAGMFCYSIGRQELGLQKLQQAYCASVQMQELAQAAQIIFQKSTSKIQQNANHYLKNMMENKFYLRLSPSDQSQIEKYSGENQSIIDQYEKMSRISDIQSDIDINFSYKLSKQ